MLQALIKAFIKENGRKPNAIELLKLKLKASGQTGKEKVLKIPTKYKKPPSPEKESFPIFGNPAMQEALKHFQSMGTLGEKGIPSFMDLMAMNMQYTDKQIFNVLKKYGWKPKVVSKLKTGLKEKELQKAAEDVGLGSFRADFTRKYPPHKVSNELGFRRKEYPAGVEPGSVAAKAIDEADAILGASAVDESVLPTADANASEKAARISIDKLKKDLPHLSRNDIDQLTKDLVNRKLFPDFNDTQRKEVFDAIEYQTTNKPDFASGGRAGFSKGGIGWLLGLIKGQFGKNAITTADKLTRPESATTREMFEEFNKKYSKKKYKQGDAITSENFAETGFAPSDDTLNILSIARIGPDDLRAKYPGITDELAELIGNDTNLQRKAEALAAIEQAMALRGAGKSADETIEILKRESTTKMSKGGLARILEM